MLDLIGSMILLTYFEKLKSLEIIIISVLSCDFLWVNIQREANVKPGMKNYPTNVCLLSARHSLSSV